MIASLLLLAQATQVVVTPSPPPRPAPTIRSETVPGFDLTCRLVDEDLAPFVLVLRQRGGRGYVDPESGYPRRSRIDISIVRDDSGLFSAGGRLIGDSDGYRVTRVEGRHPERGAVKLETFTAGRDRLAVLVHTDALARIDFTGFCDQVRHPQTPMTEAETREYLR
ncbi:MAG TPA: hypothetical protein VGB08_06860 [Allosphingosinicella sp.]|jgi:hypothetical protein